MQSTDKQYAKNIHFYSESLPKELENLVKKKKVKTLLDLGCGDGAILFALKQKGWLKKKRVLAADISQERVNRVKKIDRQFICLVVDACQLDKVVGPKTADLVISSQVIEHVPNQEEFIKQTKRVLKPKGLLYLSTVFKKWYGRFFYKNKADKWVLDPTHLREYQGEEELVPLLEKLGFRIIKQQKTLWRFPLTDFLLKRFGFGSDIYLKNEFLKRLRIVRLPILGYYNWEIICQKVRSN